MAAGAFVVGILQSEAREKDTKKSR
jgi:hypothetical protein